MKGYLLRNTVTIMVTVVTAVQCMGGIVSVSADETSVSEKKTRYEMTESIGMDSRDMTAGIIIAKMVTAENLQSFRGMRALNRLVLGKEALLLLVLFT